MAKKVTDRVLDAMPWLDSLAEPLQQAVINAVRSAGDQGQKAKDLLHGRWLGHPLHPALVAVPLGAWTATVALDLAGMEDAADISLGLGVAGAISAALAGTADWSETYGTDRRLGLLHALLNTAGLGMNVTSLALRRTGARKAGVALSMAAYAMANAAGYLGGELSYSRGVGVNHTAWDQPPEEFTAAIAVDKLEEGKPVRGEAGGMAVVLVKQGETIFALDAVCTHAGGPLDEGTVEGNAIICPWHGSTFCLADGAVLRSPASEPAIHFATRIRDGMVEVRRDDT
ncbi:MAG TPA: Rieske 2Fe-2S domain-containing protein [Chloroflexota bacterium]|jgi:nitrite reductase/ring-hydroxylating ferredoxin subunit/uncharacterized membrane protein|nr:Rieske 2Fe-2S domain-containing protein [Chloroflexota bacterium]